MSYKEQKPYSLNITKQSLTQFIKDGVDTGCQLEMIARSALDLWAPHESKFTKSVERMLDKWRDERHYKALRAACNRIGAVLITTYSSNCCDRRSLLACRGCQQSLWLETARQLHDKITHSQSMVQTCRERIVELEQGVSNKAIEIAEQSNG
jgi:hypothetical protein